MIRNEWKSAVKQGNPEIEAMDVPTFRLKPDDDEEAIKKWDEEFKECFSVKKYVSSGGTGYFPGQRGNLVKGNFNGAAGYTSEYSMMGSRDWDDEKKYGNTTKEQWTADQMDEVANYEHWLTESEARLAYMNIENGIAWDRGLEVYGQGTL